MHKELKFRDIVMTFINAVDVVNPILKNHHRRSSIIAYHIGKNFGLDQQSLSNLVFAASIHDIGALTVQDEGALKLLDVENPEPHALLGEAMMSSYKPFDRVSKIIAEHHVKYSEKKDLDIPIEAYILHLADRIEVLSKVDKLMINQINTIYERIKPLNGNLFHPEVFSSLETILNKEYIWFEIDDLSISDILNRIDLTMMEYVDDNELEDLVFTLSKVIDYKSEFTATHSIGVAHVSERLARLMNLSDATCSAIKFAGFLHDIGKLAVPSEILAKPSKLTVEEFNIIKSHPYYTYKILSNIEGLNEIAWWAGSHHEKKNLRGYPRKPEDEEIGIEIEIVAYADVFVALSEKRPYRDGLTLDLIMDLMKQELIEGMGDRVLNVIKMHQEELYNDLIELRKNVFKEYRQTVDQFKIK